MSVQTPSYIADEIVYGFYLAACNDAGVFGVFLLAEAKNNFSRITTEVNRTGEPVTVYKNNKPWVIIAPVSHNMAIGMSGIEPEARAEHEDRESGSAIAMLGIEGPVDFLEYIESAEHVNYTCASLDEK